LLKVSFASKLASVRTAPDAGSISISRSWPCEGNAKTAVASKARAKEDFRRIAQVYALEKLA
jgi:hypothetical protein